MHQAGGEMTLTCSKTLQQFEILLFFFILHLLFPYEHFHMSSCFTND